MALAPGTRLGVFEITAQIGEGGMGAVYRATDTSLSRQVAIKVLPDAFAADPDRLVRFEREAKTLASLNHPHIAAIYAIEKSAGATALVMELVEGDDLSRRIARGAIPLDEALPLAKQIAEALEAAHEQGIIHRDLKPANIKIREDGTVKVLDFGLAKALDPLTNASSGAMMTNSPTMTSPALMTGVGVLLGTAAYMSPEQAKGRPADKRSDVWSFGCVMFEMLTGARAFHGEDVADTLAAVLRGEPDWSLLPDATPEPLRMVLRRCLEKDRRARVSDIGIVRYVMTQTTAARPTSAASNGPIGWGAVVALALGAAIAGTFAGWLIRSPSAPGPTPVTRFSVALPADQRLSAPRNHILALSPDGARLVYVANRQLFVRAMDKLIGVPIRGTDENPTEVFFSPDGQWVGYFVAMTSGPVDRGQLKKIPINGGAPVVIATIESPSGVTWIGDRIIFGQTWRGIFEVPAGGGSPKLLVPADEKNSEWLHGPQLLPDDATLLFTVGRGRDRWDEADIVIASLKTGARNTLIHAGTDGRYLATGHIVYVRAGILFAQPFDLRRLEVTGGASSIVEGVTEDPNSPVGSAQFSVSSQGSLAFLPGLIGLARQMVWVDRQGIETPLSAPIKNYSIPRVSPDGTKVAVTVREQGESNIWTWDLIRETLTRLTIEKSGAAGAIWTPDSRRLVFSTNLLERGDGLFLTSADGTGQAQRLTTSARFQEPNAVTADGKTLLFTEQNAAINNGDLKLVSLTAPGEPRVLLGTAFSESRGELSPDGRWLAYMSNESGANQVFVRKFPEVDQARTQVSVSGGIKPVWAPDGRELFYWNADGLYKVPIASASGLTAGKPVFVFATSAYDGSGPSRGYDISPDGKRFLVLKLTEAAAPQPMTIVQHWFEELKAQAPTK